MGVTWEQIAPSSFLIRAPPAPQPSRFFTSSRRWRRAQGAGGDLRAGVRPLRKGGRISTQFGDLKNLTTINLEIHTPICFSTIISVKKLFSLTPVRLNRCLGESGLKRCCSMGCDIAHQTLFRYDFYPGISLPQCPIQYICSHVTPTMSYTIYSLPCNTHNVLYNIFTPM